MGPGRDGAVWRFCPPRRLPPAVDTAWACIDCHAIVEETPWQLLAPDDSPLGKLCRDCGEIRRGAIDDPPRRSN